MSSTVSGTLFVAAMVAEASPSFSRAAGLPCFLFRGGSLPERPLWPQVRARFPRNAQRPAPRHTRRRLSRRSSPQPPAGTMGAGSPEIDFFFRNADAVQKYLVSKGLVGAQSDLAVFIVVAQITLCMYIPFRLIQWLTFREHAAVPKLDVPLTAEEQQENADKKWVRRRSPERRSGLGSVWFFHISN